MRLRKLTGRGSAWSFSRFCPRFSSPASGWSTLPRHIRSSAAFPFSCLCWLEGFSRRNYYVRYAGRTLPTVLISIVPRAVLKRFERKIAVQVFCRLARPAGRNCGAASAAPESRFTRFTSARIAGVIWMTKAYDPEAQQGARANADICHVACYLTVDRMKPPTADRSPARAAPAVVVAHL